MNWSRAVHHVESLAESCAEMVAMRGPIFRVEVQQLWAFGDILGPGQELETVSMALVINLPPVDVPWLCRPPATEHWANATRMNRNPISYFWRSASVPVWNHYIVRPALVWDEQDGVRRDLLAALAAGEGDRFRSEAPAPAEYRARLEAELALSFAAFGAATREYGDRRWKPGKLTPLADRLWEASDGYLDILAATNTP